MLVWTMSEYGKHDTAPPVFGTADAEPFREIILFEEKTTTSPLPRCDDWYRLDITLVDWASVIEIDAIVVDSVSAPPN
jgi:hypothetical protein